MSSCSRSSGNEDKAGMLVKVLFLQIEAESY